MNIDELARKKYEVEMISRARAIGRIKAKKEFETLIVFRCLMYLVIILALIFIMLCSLYIYWSLFVSS